MGISHKAIPAMESGFRFNRAQLHRYELDDRTIDLVGNLNFFEREGEHAKHRRLSAALEEQVLALYDEYRPRLFRYIRSMNLNRDQAEEVIQETFMRLTTRLLKNDDIENVPGWIVRVAHNYAVDLLKKNGRDSPGNTDHTFTIENRVDPTPNPEEVYSRKEQIKQMEMALATLNPQQRQCFQLRAQGFGYKDIGLTFGISEQRAALIVKQVAVRLAAICG
jgi:RNA polymerase sigma-70 factor (ECF subfamily)